MIEREPTLGDLMDVVKDAPPKILAKIVAFARRAVDPELAGLPDWLVNAPEDDEPVTEEDRADLREAERGIAAGKWVSSAEAKRRLLD